MTDIEKKTIIETIKSQFNNLKFDKDKHQYTVNGNTLTSVSRMLDRFKVPFDAETIAGFVAKSRDCEVSEVLAEWEENRISSCRFGTRVHDFGERFVADRYKIEVNTSYYDVYQHIGPDEELEPQEIALQNFWRDKPSYIVPILLELQMYDENHKIAGTADLIFIDTRDMTIIIGDYKTNKDLFKQYKDQKLLGIFSDLPDTPFSKYEIQLSFYRMLIELTGLKVSRTFLVWLKQNGEYEIFDTEDYSDRLRKYLNKDEQSW